MVLRLTKYKVLRFPISWKVRQGRRRHIHESRRGPRGYLQALKTPKNNARGSPM